jgi:predicted MFS family arabinose efflux permease
MLRTRFIPARTSETMLASMKQGIRFVLKHGAMGSLIMLAFAMTMFSVPLMVFLPVFAKDVFHSGSGTFTLLLSFSGVGSVCGALVFASLSKSKRQGRAALILIVILGAVIALFAQSKSIVLSCFLIFLCGAALMGVFASISSLVQLITADEFRGRVMSVYNVAFRGGMPIGSLAVGSVSQSLSAPAVFTWNGILLAALGLYFLFGRRKVAAL